MKKLNYGFGFAINIQLNIEFIEQPLPVGQFRGNAGIE